MESRIDYGAHGFVHEVIAGLFAKALGLHVPESVSVVFPPGLLGLPKASEGQKAADKAIKLMEMIDSSVHFVREGEAMSFAETLATEMPA